jgi:chromosome segregation ATPase
MSVDNTLEKIRNQIEDLSLKRTQISEFLERNDEKIKYHDREIKKAQNILDNFKKEREQLVIRRTLDQRQSLKIEKEIKRLKTEESILVRKSNKKLII